MKQVWRTRLRIAAFPLAALALSALIYSGLAERNARVAENWRQLEGALAQQLDLAPRLHEVVGEMPLNGVNRNGPARDVAVGLAELDALQAQAQLYLSDRRVLDDQERMSDLASAGGELNRSLTSIVAAAKLVSAAGQSTAYVPLAEEIVAADRRLARAKAEFNQAVREHNRAMRRFPMRLFARLGDFRPRTYFRTAQTGQS